MSQTLQARRPVSVTSLVGDYLQLIRPRILLMVLFVVCVAFCVAGDEPRSVGSLVQALVGAGLVSAGSLALNQRIEWRSDAVMTRTSLRPLPGRRMALGHASVFGAGLTVVGLAVLILGPSPSTAVVAFGGWLVYVVFYTPMKRVSAWQTAVGAVAGAIPALIGGAAAGASFSPVAIGLFAVLYLWQLPHAMAIAWLYRQQYRTAGIRVVTITESGGRVAGTVAVAGAAALVPVSVVASRLASGATALPVLTLAAGLAYLASAGMFFLRPDDARARWLLRTSLLYLPTFLSALLLFATGAAQV